MLIGSALIHKQQKNNKINEDAIFNLKVVFTNPSDISPNPGVYQAVLQGKISAGSSSAVVVWSDTSLTFYSSTIGKFSLNIEPFTPINAPSSPDASRIRGVLNLISQPVTSVPEPTNLVLLGTGLLFGSFLCKKKYS